jgi:hypothetical protein
MTAMTIITFVFGSLITLVSLIGMIIAWSISPPALFPLAIGFSLIACAAIARDPGFHRRGMKGAAFAALAGLGGTVSSVAQLIPKLKTISISGSPLVIVQSATALLCLIFLVRCFQEELVTRREKKERGKTSA